MAIVTEFKGHDVPDGAKYFVHGDGKFGFYKLLGRRDAADTVYYYYDCGACSRQYHKWTQVTSLPANVIKLPEELTTTQKLELERKAEYDATYPHRLEEMVKAIISGAGGRTEAGVVDYAVDLIKQIDKELNNATI